MSDADELIGERMKKLENIKKAGIDPFGKRFLKTQSCLVIRKKFEKIKPEERVNTRAKLAGRIKSIRRHGKLIFALLEDFTGRIQLVLEFGSIGRKQFDFFENISPGDILGVEGTIYKTKKGELSIWVEEYEILAKALRPIPSDWFGVKDRELKYRERYVDLIANPGTREIFKIRSLIIREMRNFLESMGFLEVTTPVLQPLYGGALAEPFITHHRVLNRKLYLRISPELYLKRAIVGGFEKIYEIAQNFRNEGIDTKHNPEFTMMESYWAFADYNDNMKLTEELIGHIAEKVLGTKEIEYQGIKISLKPPYRRITAFDLIKKEFKIPVEKETPSSLKSRAKKLGIEIPAYADKGFIIAELMDKAMKKVVRPTFIIDFPIEVSPLAKTKKDDPRLTERFELVIAGDEFANAYTEENNPIEQRKKFEGQIRLREAGDKEAHVMDEDYIRALEFGMAPTSGLGIGVDRLVMLLTNSPSIRDVIMFPVLREKG